MHIPNESGFNLLAEAVIFTDRFDEASHELISFVLEKFMPLVAVFRRSLRVFNSIRVGLTFNRAI